MLCLLAGLAVAAPAPGPLLTYTENQVVSYTVTGEVVANGQDEVGGQLGDGLAYINSTMVTKCTGTNGTHYSFLMNMFATSVSNDGGHTWHQVASDELGEDVEYLQARTGEVTEIVISEEDSQLVANVKVGAVNALHTFLVAEGSSATVDESTPVGTHASTMTGSAGPDDRLHVAKTFDQSSITAFADPDLKPGQLSFDNHGYVQQHAEGWLHTASCTQHSLLMKADVDAAGNVRVSGSAAAPADAGDVEMNFTSTLHSRGVYNLSFTANPPHAAVEGAARLSRPSLFLLGAARPAGRRSTTLFEFGRAAAVAARPAPASPATEPSPTRRLRRDLPPNPDMPFNKSYAASASIGPHGKHNWDTLFANVTADVFIGTNFDCRQPTFNYEAEAHAESWLDLFGTQKQVFFAQFVYGADNGQHLADQAVVDVWGKQVYQKSIAAVDCSPHTVPVAHSAPGFDKSFTIWTSFIPVTLHIKTQLDLDLSYTWSVCDTDLSASVALNPAATLTVTGSAEVNLLIIETTTALEAAFSQSLVPTLKLRGSECAVDFTVERKSNPMTAKFHSYYKYKHCKFLIFDCKWSNQYDKVWWQWEHPAVDDPVYSHTYNISL